ncbi:MAG: ChaN family lipoprotein [Rhodobacteraceae bacterium]|jgi:uncharacterized iron-regulated protein|nr:ChaN family lipoprotein [Paracoccaceae bacterium]
MNAGATALALCLCLALAVLPAAGREIEGAALDRLPAAEITLLGEIHDNPQHHLNQARAVAAILPRALVFEMLPEGVAPDPAAGRDAAALAAAIGWNGRGWPDFALYAPIFAAAPQARIYGAELPRPEVRRAIGDGAAAVFGPRAARFGLTEPLPEALLQDALDEQFAAHCGAMPREALSGMVEAQRLRDAALARAALRALEETGGPVAVIAGAGHVRRDRGLPFVLAAAAPGVTVLAVGQGESAESADSTAAPADLPFDLWLLTPPAPREDPCAAFSGG